MSLDVEPVPVPLTVDPDGVVRVGSTRVTLDTIVAAFDAGDSAEEISQAYPSLDLVDVYAVITFYLQHGAAVERYLGARRKAAVRVRIDAEARVDPAGIRARLLARRQV